MNIFTGKNRQNIFLRFLASYLILLIIPIIVGVYVYQGVYQIINDDIKNANLSILKQSRDIIDARLAEVDIMVKQLALNPKVLTLLNMDSLQEGSPDIYKVFDVKMDLSSYRITNSFIKEFYIYSRKSNVILSTYKAYTQEQLFYGYFMKYNNMSLEQWKENIVDKYHNNVYLPASPVILENREHSIIIYLQSIPLGYNKEFKGAIMVLIDEDTVQKSLKELSIGSKGCFYIADENGQIITSFSETGQEVLPVELDTSAPEGQMVKNFSGEDIIITYTTSPFNKWKYVVAVPAGFAMNKANYIKRVLVFCGLLSLLVGIIIALIFAYHNAKPVKEIILSIKAALGWDTEKCLNEYDFLKGTVSKLISNNEDLQNKLIEQTPLLRAAFFMRLLDGSFRDISEVRAVMSHIGLHILGEKYLVMILKIHEYERIINEESLKELNAAKILIKDIFAKYGGNNLYTYDLDDSKISIIMTFGTSKEEKCREAVTKLAEQCFDILYNNYKIRFFLAAGKFYNSILDTGKSFEEARQGLDYNVKDRNCILFWYSEISDESRKFYYPVEVESRMLLALKSGRTDEVQKILREIYVENFDRKQLSPDMKQQLILSLRTTVFRHYEKVKMEEGPEVLLEGINYSENIDNVYKYISRVFFSICNKVNQIKNDEDNRLLGEIISYLEEVYMQDNLSLYSVSDKFGLTEAYLYKFFRDKIGQTFACYLEDMRIKKACALLSETGLSIQEVSEMVGYNSHYSFRRAFKRCKGVLPTDYRESEKTSC